MSTTPTTRPPEGHQTRLAPRGDIARYLVSRAPVPLGSFGAFINDADRDVGYQQLVTRLTADEPDPWSRAREDDVNERLRASLSTDQDRELFRQLGNHSADKAAIREAAAYLVGLEVGRQSETPIWRPLEARNLKPEAESPSTTGRSVEDVMLKVVSALWLAKLVDRERMVFRLGIQIGQRAQGGTFEPGSSTADDTAPRDVVPIGRQFTAAELMEARRPTLEDVLDEAIGALRLAEALSSLKATGDGDYTVPVEAALVLARLTGDAANHLTRLHDALLGRLITTAVDDVAAESGGAA